MSKKDEIVELTCDYCKKEYKKTKGNVNFKNKHHFCCKECNFKYIHDITHEIRKCEYCKNDFECSKKSKKRFCCKECQNEWQKTIIGEDHPKYNKKPVNCEWCKKLYNERNYKVNNNHHFCSVICRREWFAKEYSQSKEFKDKKRKLALKLLSGGVFGKADTGCQIITNNILNKLNISYINEYNINNIYSVDNFLNEKNLIIEVMGGYWHCDNRLYSTINYYIQLNRIIRDKAKHSYIFNNNKINILYLWEKDILEQPDLCEQLIILYIKNKGLLENYNSFNYTMFESKIKLNNDILKPYMEWDLVCLNEIIDISLKERISKKDNSKHIIYKCEICGKECEELISHYNKKLHHYCGLNCKYNSGRIKVICSKCGSEFYVKKYYYNLLKNKTFTCSNCK